MAAGLAFIPAVQTWLAERAFSGHAGINVSIGSLWARFGVLEAEDVRVEFPNAVLTVPALTSELPIFPAARAHRYAFHQITAKGWTLDLRPPQKEPAANDSNSPSSDTPADSTPKDVTPAAVTQAVTHAFSGLLVGRKLPADFSADEVNLEGEVLVPTSAASTAEPTHVHVTITGSGLGAGRKSALTLAIDSAFPTPQMPGFNFTAQGELVVVMDSPRTFSRIEWKPVVALRPGPLSKPIELSVDAAVSPKDADETYLIDVSKADRHFAVITGTYYGSKMEISGTWKSEIAQADLLPLMPTSPPPPFALSGEGEFDVDPPFDRLHLVGNVRGTDGRLTALATLVGAPRSGDLNTQFDLVRSGDSLHVTRLNASIGSPQPIATAVSLQPFEVSITSGLVTLSKPKSDWFAGTIVGLPLSWLSASIRPWEFRGGQIGGGFTVNLTENGFAFRGNSPMTASSVEIVKNGAPMAKDLNVEIVLSGEKDSKGWRVRGAPVSVTNDGKTAAKMDVTVSRPIDPRYPLTFETKGTVDLAALSSQNGFSGARDLPIGAITGDVVTSIGEWIHFAGDVTLAERTTTRTLSAKLNADFRKDRSLVFRVPITLSDGTTKTELATEGTWLPSKYGHEITGSLAGKNLDIESLRVLGPLLAEVVRPEQNAKIRPQASSQGEVNAKADTVPFWGDVVGRLTFNAETLKFGGSELQDVHGTFRFEPKGLFLDHAMYQLSNHLAEANASVSFDAAAQVRYHVTGTFDDGEIDAEPLFGKPPEGQDPPFHGKFKVASALKGEGNTLDELLARTQQEFRLTSTSGIVRLLKTHVTGITHEKESKVGDAADVVGGLFGKVAGVKPNSIRTGEVKLSKTTDNILNFSYDCGEIGYSELNITASRGSDGALHVDQLTMIAPDEHLTATGEVSYVKGAPLTKEPLSLVMQFGVKGQTADLLAGSGLLSANKDGLGYTLFEKPIRLSGSLEHLDVTEWHDLLYGAALRTAEPKKK